jgi:hypothetical protein
VASSGKDNDRRGVDSSPDLEGVAPLSKHGCTANQAPLHGAGVRLGHQEPVHGGIKCGDDLVPRELLIGLWGSPLVVASSCHWLLLLVSNLPEIIRISARRRALLETRSQVL